LGDDWAIVLCLDKGRFERGQSCFTRKTNRAKPALGLKKKKIKKKGERK